MQPDDWQSAGQWGRLTDLRLEAVKPTINAQATALKENTTAINVSPETTIE
jgi:hypothetical protein